MEYLIGIDLGTSGTKTVLFDRLGKVIASATVEYPMYQERNGWAEQDPLDWWHASCETLQSVIQQGGVDPRDIKGLGISGQMHGLVMLDKQGRVLRRSIIWCDQRTARQCEEITQRVGKERLIQITANPALTGFTASKILWVRENEPELYAQCAHILLPKDYVRYMLTGEFATEVSDASGMQLLDVPHRCWSQEVLEKLDIDPALLAKVYESPEITGAITPEAAALTGLAAGTPVVGGAGDNAAAAVGTGVVADGKAFTMLNSMANFVTLRPEHVWSKVEGEYAEYTGEDAAIGCGPYKLTGVDEEAQSMTLEAVSDTDMGQELTVRKLTVRTYDSHDALVMALRSGEVDAMYDYSNSLNATMVDSITGVEGLDPGMSDNPGNYQLVFGFNEQPTDDLIFRKAVRAALDYELLRVTIGGEDGQIPHAGIVAPPNKGFDGCGIQVNTWIPSAPLSSLVHAPAAELNLVKRVRWARRMREKFGTAYLHIGGAGRYAGLDGICTFYRDIGQALRMEAAVEPVVLAARAQALEETAEARRRLGQARAVLVSRSIQQAPFELKSYVRDYGLSVSHLCVILTPESRKNLNVTPALEDSLLARVREAAALYSPETQLLLNPAEETLRGIFAEADVVVGTGDFTLEGMGAPLIPAVNETTSLSFPSYVRTVRRMCRRLEHGTERSSLLLGKMPFQSRHYPLYCNQSNLAAKEMWSRMWLNRKGDSV